MNRKWYRITLISFTGAILLAQFQNCAPAGSHMGTDVSDEIRVIEDWIEAKVTFVEPALDLQADVDSMGLEGLCARKGADLLMWQLNDDQGEVLFRGEAQCLGGGFALEMDQLNSLDCGNDHWLWVTTPEGEGAALRVKKRCPPVFYEMVEGDSDGTEACYMELVGQDEDMSCQKVCYLEGRVYYQENEDLGACSQMQARAADY